MDSPKRNAAALHDRVERLCNVIIQEHLLNILRNAEEDEASDYATAAYRELCIKEQGAALIRTTQDLSTLIRELQELWLFGSLDTLADRTDEKVNRDKALAVAEMIEALAKQGPVVRHEAEKKESEDGENGVAVQGSSG